MRCSLIPGGMGGALCRSSLAPTMEKGRNQLAISPQNGTSGVYRALLQVESLNKGVANYILVQYELPFPSKAGLAPCSTSVPLPGLRLLRRINGMPTYNRACSVK